MNDPQSGTSFQRLQTVFLASITHEFRTPLASLMASLEILVEEDAHLSHAERGELLRSLQLSAIGLETLINNLLESSTIEAGHFTIHPRRVHIEHVLAEAIYLVQPLLDRRQQALVLTQPFDLPALFADPVRLTQVFVNLLTNASKYSSAGQKIDLGIDRLDDNLLIAVADRGPGIPEAAREDIFGYFKRLTDDTTNPYGAGLGLSVVKSIVEGHGGEISSEDRPGGGSIFWISLPIEGGLRENTGRR